ncbi:unnamed protein product [Cuscuta epithymum]|nr:unnamed protein product [Cuscuta epithymum]
MKPNILKKMQGLIHFLPLVLADVKAVSSNTAPEEVVPYEVEVVTGVPQQVNGGDCGFMVLKFAEVLQMTLDVRTVYPDRIADYRAKWAHDLYVYGSAKGKSLAIHSDAIKK